MYYCCGLTDIGTARDNNEDTYLIDKSVISAGAVECEPELPFMVAVADGVAGEASGEVASRTALELAAQIKVSCRTDYAKKLLDIHRTLKKRGAALGSVNMQTTFCGAAFNENGTVNIINVGDSKLFRFRGGIIRQLSTDQSLVQMLYEQGEITAREKRSHTHRNVIFPVLGNVDEEPKIDVTEIEGGIKQGDIILICTDGLSDYLTKGEMEEALSLPCRLSRRLEKLIELAKKNGSRDNITVAAISAII